MRKRLFFLLFPAAALLLSGVHKLMTFSAQTASAQLGAFTQTLFQNEVAGNTLTLHYTLQDPENYGITDPPVTYGPADTDSLVLSASSPTAADYQRSLSEIQGDLLSGEDAVTYDLLLLALENEKEAALYPLYDEPLGSSIGIQAQLPVLLAEYAFTDADDIRDYLELIAQTDSYFSTLLQYEKKKAAAGLFMSDASAEAIILQCQEIYQTAAGQELLVSVFNKKLEELNFLSAEEKASFCAANEKAVASHVLPAYELLATGLSSLKGSGKNENGLCYFPMGKTYYEHLMRSQVGSYLPVDAIERRIRRQLAADLTACRELLAEHPNASSANALSSLPKDPQDILADLRNKLQAEYPDSPDTEVSIKYVNEALEDFLSPAFYLMPPIDDCSQNVIYINGASVTDGLELYTTLAHEGYPGHLYQNICTGERNPARSLFSFPGYTEGWATYAEMDSFSYAAAGSSPTVSEEDAAVSTQALEASASNRSLSEAGAAAEYARLNRSVMLGISSLLDISIHYRGFTRQDTAQFLENLGFSSSSAADALFDAILEAPANYLKYYVGYLTFLDLRDYCSQTWPDAFEIKDFHRQILKIGPAPFPVVEKYLKEYYMQK